jgi:uncharacterized membrane protein YkoI
MTETTKRRLVALASVAALGLGGAAVADAVSSGTNSAQSNGAAPTGHARGAETALTGDTAAKVKAAALAKTGGGTVDRVETDADGHAAYEAHITKADGTHVTVYVDAQFNVVGSETGGPRGRHGRHGRGAETALTGDTAAKVKAAALAKTGGGTVDRVENDADGHAPYEAHITKADGTHVTVYVNAKFNVVGVETGR